MKQSLRKALIIVCSVTFLISAGMLAKYYIDSYRQQKSYADLQQIMEAGTLTPRPTIPEDDTAEAPEPQPPSLVEVTDPETGARVSLLPQFKDLFLRNNHLVGWMTIPGTDINYPVMQTPEQTDYYLTRNFERESSKHGCLYAREVCDIKKPSDNITIYGHRMKDRSMFGQLDKFMVPGFCKENPYIYFDTLTEQHTYQILSVFLTTATAEEGFYYHAFVDAADEAEFQSFVDTCKQLALFDTGVTANYGDKLITLSTCEYSQDNGRLVIVAKRVV